MGGLAASLVLMPFLHTVSRRMVRSLTVPSSEQGCACGAHQWEACGTAAIQGSHALQASMHRTCTFRKLACTVLLDLQLRFCTREDECARVKEYGARIMTLDQLEGVKVCPRAGLQWLHPYQRPAMTGEHLMPQDPTVQCWGTEEEDDGDPPRLWAPNAMYPGTAFTRSLGDTGLACGRCSCLPARR